MAENTPPRFSIVRKVVLGLCMAVLMLAAIGFIAYRSTREFITTASLVAHSREVIGREQALLHHVTEAQSGARGYLLSGDDAYLQPYEEAQVRIVQDFNALKKLSQYDPEQSIRLDGIRELISRELAMLKEAISQRHDKDINAALEVLHKNSEEELMLKIRAAMSEFENVEQQMLVERSGRTRRIGETTTSAIVLTGLLTAVVLAISALLIARDFAARRRAEEALAHERNLLGSIIDAMADNVFVKDTGGRYILDNAAHRRFIGAEKLEDVAGKTVFDFLPKELAESFANADRTVAETGEPLLNVEEPASVAQTPEKWFSTTRVPLKNREGVIIGTVGVSRDITKQKESEEKLRSFAEQLERSNRELQDFASVASHDLQEPLRKILAFGDRLRAKCGEALGEVGRDYLDRIQDAAGRMQTLIHDLLTLSRVTSRAQPFVPVDLTEIMWDVISDLDERIRQTDARIEVGALPSIEADPPQMRQLFQNLLSNALKFHRIGQRPVIGIAGRIFEPDEAEQGEAASGERVCKIIVQDNGIGFDEKYSERIFAVFQRLHARHEYPGTGIGLAVCRKIVDRHGGSIIAKSVQGKGATFIVTLPLKQRMKETHE